MNTNSLIFCDLESQFLLDRKTKQLSPKTIQSYSSELRYFHEFLRRNNLDTQPFLTLTPTHLRQYFLELSSHRKKSSINLSYTILKCLFLWFEDEFDVEWKNPIRKIKLPRPKTEPLPGIPLETVSLLLANCDGVNKNRDSLILLFLLDSGLRGSEFCSLNLEDVSLESGLVKVRNGKGNKSRIVFVGRTTLQALRDYLNSRNDSESALILTNDGKRFSYLGLREVIRRLCRKVGVRWFGTHSFRRSFSINMYRSGVPLLSLSKILGHESPNVTQRYLALTNEDLQDVYKSPVDLL